MQSLCVSRWNSSHRVMGAAVAGLAAALLSTAPTMASDGTEKAAPLSLSTTPQSMDAAPPAQAAPAADDDNWHLTTRFGIWGVSLNGTIGAGRAEKDVDASFSDLMENANFASSPGIEVSKDRWTLMFNGFLTQLEDSKSFSRTMINGQVVQGDVDTKVDLDIADLALAYRLFDIPLGDQGMRLSLSPAVGVRYTYLSAEIDPSRLPSRSGDQDWWDPYIGARVNLKITDSLAWRTDASWGGWGIGCDTTWLVQSMLDWRFTDSWELNVGYRALYQNYNDNGVKWDMTMQGPWIGVSKRWF